jgi:hypothetical protein
MPLTWSLGFSTWVMVGDCLVLALWGTKPNQEKKKGQSRRRNMEPRPSHTEVEKYTVGSFLTLVDELLFGAHFGPVSDDCAMA